MALTQDFWRTASMRGVFSAIACLGSAIPAEGVVVSDDPGLTGDSHLVTPGVESFGVNLDGVVQLISGQPYCTGSLVSDRHVLTAAHCDPRAGETVGFEGTDGFTYIDVASATLHPDYFSSEFGNDVAVLTLDEVAPSWAPRYELYRGVDEVGAQLVVAGYGTSGHGAFGDLIDDNMKRAGLNRYDATIEQTNSLFGFPPSVSGSQLVYDFDDGSPTHDAFGRVGGPSDLGLGADEVVAGFGDSGGPSFINDGGVYRIAGVVSWGDTTLADVNSQVDASWGELNMDTRVSTYASFIDNVIAGVPPTGAPTGVLYRAFAGSEPSVNIGGQAVTLPLGDDDSEPTPLGFDFKFYGQSLSEVFVSSNGFLTVGAGSGDYEAGDLTAEPSPMGADLPMIAPFWDDLAPNDGGVVRYATVGAPGERRFVVEWDGVEFFDSFDTVGFQVILEEATGDVVFVYHDVESEAADRGGEASVGIRPSDGHLTGESLQWSLYEAVLYDGLSIRFSVNPLPGDYNGDGLVNAADYVVWRDTSGATDATRFVGADHNGDGAIDRLDYTLWAERYGGALAAEPSVTVPEPAAIVAALAASLAIATRRRDSGAATRCAVIHG